MWHKSLERKISGLSKEKFHSVSAVYSSLNFRVLVLNCLKSSFSKSWKLNLKLHFFLRGMKFVARECVMKFTKKIFQIMQNRHTKSEKNWNIEKICFLEISFHTILYLFFFFVVGAEFQTKAWFRTNVSKFRTLSYFI